MTAAPIISSSCCFSFARRCSLFGFLVFSEPLGAFVDDALPGSVAEPQVDQCGDLLAMFGGDLWRRSFPWLPTRQKMGSLDLFCFFFWICCSPVNSLSSSSAISPTSLAVDGTLDAIDSGLHQRDAGECFSEHMSSLLMVEYLDGARVGTARLGRHFAWMLSFFG